MSDEQNESRALPEDKAAKLREMMEATPELQELEIRVKMAAVTFGDIEMVMGYQDGKIPMNELLPFLNRVIEGGTKSIPILAYPKVLDALNEAFSFLVDTKN